VISAHTASTRAGEPFCVVCCEGQAVHFGDINDPDGGVFRMVAKRERFLLQADADAGPSVPYLAPKPRRPL
jgi:Fe-S-cluster-containing dehydrogenase component